MLFFEYCQNLYTEEDIDTNIQDNFLEYTQKPTNEQQEELEQTLDIDTFEDVLSLLSEESTPGPDGITVPFYKAFFPVLRPYFIDMLKETFEEEGLPESQNLFYITLIPKDSGSPLERKKL